MKRRVILVLLLLVAGAIVNVAVAWAFALWGPRSDLVEVEIEQRDIQEWNRFAPPNAPPRPTIATNWGSAGRASRLLTAIGERPDPRAGLQYEMAIFQFGVDVFGWPAQSLGWHYHDSPEGPRYSYTLPRNPALTNEYQLGTAVPIRVFWPGFAINTVFYALVLWLLFAAPLALRRRRRIKRGLCPKCAYDLRGSKDATTCPECGATVTPSLVR